MKTLMNLTSGGLFALSTLFLQGCMSSSDSSSGNTLTELDVAIQQAVNNSIVPAVDNFQAQTQTLNTQAETFCSDGNTIESNLTGLQSQWKAVQNAWYELQPFNFGPLHHDDLYWYIDSFRGNDGRDSTETVRSDIQQMVTGSDELTATVFQNKGSSTSGLLPLEVALFETVKNTDNETSQTLADIVTEFANTPRKCEVLTGYTTELLRRSSSIVEGWKTDYRDTGKGYLELLLNEELENTFPAFDDDGSGAPIIEVIITALHDYFDYLANENRPLTSSMGQLSGSIWDAVQHSVDSFENLFEGTNDTSVSLFNKMSKNGFEQNVAAVRANIVTIELAISEQNNTDMKAAAASIDGNLEHEIPNALDASLGLSFNDGD